MQEIPQIFVDQPAAIPERFVKAWNDRDAAQIAGLFVEDAEFVNVVGLWWHTRQDIWKAHDYGLKVIFKDSTLALRQKKVRYLSEEIALVHARLKLSGQSAHGSTTQPGTRFNIFSFIVQKKPKGWVCIAAHNTDKIQGMETNVIDASGKIQAVDYRSNS